MSKNNKQVTGDLSAVVSAIEERLFNLEKEVRKLGSQRGKVRKVREFSDKQRAAIRARLLAGKEAARKRREKEEKVTPKPQNKKESKSADIKSAT